MIELHRYTPRRYYIPLGMFATKEEAESDPRTPRIPISPIIWERYVACTLYLSVWEPGDGPAHWGYFTRLDWALEKGYVPLEPCEDEEVII